MEEGIPVSERMLLLRIFGAINVNGQLRRCTFYTHWKVYKMLGEPYINLEEDICIDCSWMMR